MELTPEQAARVQAQVPIIGLLNAFYNRFGEDAFQVSKEFSFQFGKQVGENIKAGSNISGTDANAVAAVLNAFLMEASGAPIGVPDFVKMEGNEVTAANEGFCAIMEAVKVAGVPHDKTCPNYSWSIFEGIASAVNPQVRQEVRESRAFGDKRCQHVIIVP